MAQPHLTPGPLYTVSELARAANVTRRTVQHYADLGMLTPGVVTVSGRELYTEFALTLLRDVIDLRQMGLGLDEIRNIMVLKKAIFHADGTYRDDWRREDVPLTNDDLSSMRDSMSALLESIARQEQGIRRFHKFLTKHFARPAQAAREPSREQVAGDD